MNASRTPLAVNFAAKSRAGRTGRTWDHPSLLDSYSSINFVSFMRPLRLSNWFRGAFSLHGASTPIRVRPQEPERLGEGAMTRALCPWCESPFTPRRTGGKPQRFCRDTCRAGIERKLRAWARDQMAAGDVTRAQLQRARSRDGPAMGANAKVAEIMERDTGSKRALSQPGMGSCPTGPRL
jgi:hypothetical protein